MADKQMAADALWKIYERFTEQLVNHGWKGQLQSWREVVESELDKGSTMLFELRNGFRLKFSEKENGEANLVYWFADTENEKTPVETLEQLLQL